MPPKVLPLINWLTCIVIYPQLPFNKCSPSLRVTHPMCWLQATHTVSLSRLSLLGPKLNLLSSRETRRGFCLCDLQGGSFLQLLHLLGWDKMPPPIMSLLPGGASKTLRDPQRQSRNHREIRWPWLSLSALYPQTASS